MAPPGTAPETAPYRVFSQAQACRIVGVAVSTMSERLKLRAKSGTKVFWDRDDPDNPMGCLLIAAEWVQNYANDRGGAKVEIRPSIVTLPVRPGLSPYVNSADFDQSLLEIEYARLKEELAAQQAKVAEAQAKLGEMEQAVHALARAAARSSHTSEEGHLATLSR